MNETEKEAALVAVRSNDGLEARPCSECGETGEVITDAQWWTAWGKNAFDFNWQKHSGALTLCEKCEDEGWVVCSECGACVDRDFYGTGYPEDFDGEHICPECALKKGIAISVSLASAEF